jgi:hypothetical protein
MNINFGSLPSREALLRQFKNYSRKNTNQANTPNKLKGEKHLEDKFPIINLFREMRDITDNYDTDNLIETERNLKRIEDKYLNTYPNERGIIRMLYEHAIRKFEDMERNEPYRKEIIKAKKEIYDAFYDNRYDGKNVLTILDEIEDKYIDKNNEKGIFKKFHSDMRFILLLYYRSLLFGFRTNKRRHKNYSLASKDKPLLDRLELIEEAKDRLSRQRWNTEWESFMRSRESRYQKQQLKLASNAKSVSGKLELTEENKQRLANRKLKSMGRSYVENTQRVRSVSANRHKITPLKERNDENPYVISEKIFASYCKGDEFLTGLRHFGIQGWYGTTRTRKFSEFDKLMKENPSDLIHFLVSYHLFLIPISKQYDKITKCENITIDDIYPSVKEMGDIYIGQGVEGVIHKLREIDIEFMKKNKYSTRTNTQIGDSAIPILKSANELLWAVFIQNYEYKLDLYRYMWGICNKKIQRSDKQEKEEKIKYLKEKYIEEHPTDTRCELVFMLIDRWLDTTQTARSLLKP